jgi:hypothetical protein
MQYVESDWLQQTPASVALQITVAPQYVITSKYTMSSELSVVRRSEKTRRGCTALVDFQAPLRQIKSVLERHQQAEGSQHTNGTNRKQNRIADSTFTAMMIVGGFLI